MASKLWTLKLTLGLALALTAWLQPAIARQALPSDLSQLEADLIQPEKYHKDTLLEVLHHLKFSHYLQKKHQLDDRLSQRLLDHYIDRLDPNRVNFYQSDINRIKAYQNRLDDALRAGNLKPGFDIFNTYQIRSIERLIYSIKFLETKYQQLDLKQDAYLFKDRGELAYANTRKEIQQLWNKQIKAAVLTQKLIGKSDKEIQTLLIKRYRNRLSQRVQLSSEDVFQLFTNSLTSIYDPHTEYLSPRASDNFNINMSLSLEGIGAVLQSEDEYTKVVRLVPGGPADKSHQLHPEDKIIAVGQGNEPLVDIVGLRIEKVVEMIRGPKGSTVALEVIPSQAKSSKTRVIQIIRDTVELEDRAAKSDILKLPAIDTTSNSSTAQVSLGIIRIPTFYADFKGQQAGKRDYRRTSTDVKKLIEQLSDENIQGLVIDLRNNGGGSLQEANRVLGLFIKTGPTVQVRDSLNRIDLHRDRDRGLAYDGPLVVLVNRLSASASEIFAGAIQDYQRGLIVGSRTFGKGTVQALRQLDHGQLKFTQLKFYRVSGGSNQHLGIVPDIEFPSLYDPNKVGESAQDNALAWDTIKPARFKAFSDLDEYTPLLKARHEQRILSDPDFKYLTSKVSLIRALDGKTRISLNETKRRKELTENRAKELAIMNKKRAAKQLKPFKTAEEMLTYEDAERANAKQTILRADDAELFEASKILRDLIYVDMLDSSAVKRTALNR